MSGELLIEARGAIEVATLNRPERLNALNGGLVDELNAYFGGLAGRGEVRVVILRGAGRGFCAGLDIQEDRSGDETPVLRTLRTQTSIGNIYRKMRACPQPIIALGHGAAALLCGLLISLAEHLYVVCASLLCWLWVCLVARYCPTGTPVRRFVDKLSIILRSTTRRAG